MAATAIAVRTRTGTAAMQIEPETAAAIGGLLGAIFTALGTVWKRRVELKSESQKEARKEDATVAVRLAELVEHSSALDQRRIETLEKRIDDQSMTIQTLSDSLAAARSTADANGRRIDELVTLNAKLARENQELQDANRALQETNRELRATCRSYLQKIEALSEAAADAGFDGIPSQATS